jgi:hypothetical protein
MLIEARCQGERMNSRQGSKMALRLAWVLIAACSFGAARGQPVVTYKAAVVALTDDSTLRAEFERGLAAKAAAIRQRLGLPPL